MLERFLLPWWKTRLKEPGAIIEGARRDHGRSPREMRGVLGIKGVAGGMERQNSRDIYRRDLWNDHMELGEWELGV